MFLLVDTLVLLAAYAAAFCVRMNFAEPIAGWQSACVSSVSACLVQMSLLTAFRLNRAWRWRVTARDMPKYVVVFALSAAVLLWMRYLLSDGRLMWARPPYSVTLIDSVFAFFAIVGMRLLRHAHRASVIDDTVSKVKVPIPDIFKGCRIMVTGAGGSIGSEIVRQVAATAVDKVFMVERSENALYKIDYEMRKFSNCVPLMVDVCDESKMEAIVEACKPDVILHAAAYKHVPMVEMNPEEGFRNNTEATEKLVYIASKNGVKKFVLISTDKAVHPKSVMGQTKREAEKAVLRMGYTVVRFGNVFGSSGSVVELWRDQIASGGPVTVTDGRMTRYFMSVEEAVGLVLTAASYSGGKIYTLDMGKPKSILKLAEQMIKDAGWRPHKDIKIVFTGIRPGEKLEEELGLEQGQRIVGTKIYVSGGGNE
ncbi:MAG: SDR family NAD(P)-dependent oxidoreductase [Kiritimatiellae bacterium]|nr:SDR family NAD(P)-dependent oxidoreductase [Kiritimatiellia bacterium]